MRTSSITFSGEEALTIGAMAKRTGVQIETIRYYERIALLPPPPRTPAGRRSYGAQHQRILTFIRRARALGFSTDAIRTLLALAVLNETSCAEVETIAQAHLETVRAKLADLARLEQVLSETVVQCQASSPLSCPVLDVLQGTDR